MSQNTNVNLRVFKRNDSNIILFWNIENLSEEQKKNVKIFLLEKQNEEDAITSKVIKELVFASTDATAEFNTSKNVAIAVIDHESNEIGKDDSILLKMVLGETDKIEQFLRVSPSGVLPFFERDHKASHVQLFGYEKGKKRWAKISLVKAKDGTFCLPVKIVE